MHTSDTMPSLSTLQNQPLTRSHSFLSTIAVTTAEEQSDLPLNLETVVSMAGLSTTLSDVVSTVTTVATLDTYTNASLEAIAASLEALSSPLVPGDGQYQMEREFLELEKMKQQRLAEELEWERQEIQRFHEQEQLLVQKELEELQTMKQQILCQQEEERQAHLLMQKETYAQQQEQLEQIQRLQEQLRQQLEEQKFRQMYPGEVLTEALVVAGERKMDSGCQTDEEDNTEKPTLQEGKRKVQKKVLIAVYRQMMKTKMNGKFLLEAGAVDHVVVKMAWVKEELFQFRPLLKSLYKQSPQEHLGDTLCR